MAAVMTQPPQRGWGPDVEARGPGPRRRPRCPSPDSWGGVPQPSRLGPPLLAHRGEGWGERSEEGAEGADADIPPTPGDGRGLEAERVKGGIGRGALGKRKRPRDRRDRENKREKRQEEKNSERQKGRDANKRQTVPAPSSRRVRGTGWPGRGQERRLSPCPLPKERGPRSTEMGRGHTWPTEGRSLKES